LQVEERAQFQLSAKMTVNWHWHNAKLHLARRRDLKYGAGTIDLT
jgi:hypothetical protein